MRELVIIEDAGRCSWAKCIFCSFSKKDAFFEPNTERLKENLEKKLRGSPEVLKYFNSGSFLDGRQITKEFRDYLVKRCAEVGVKELVVECRPEYLTDVSLEALKKTNEFCGGRLKISFALGLEIADDDVLKKVGKGFEVKDYARAAELLKQNGFGVRTYLMANLPFVKNIKKSLDESVQFALKYGDSVAILNTFPRAPAPLFELWASGKWSPLDRKEFDAIVSKYRKNKKIDIYFDDYVDYPHFSKKEAHVGANIENIAHPHYAVWQDYLSRFYAPPETKKYALFLPCSFRKPYSSSKTHTEIMRHLVSVPGYAGLHQIMISNPGVIPREFEGKYPFAHYDWPEWEETPEIKKKYVEITSGRIKRYLLHHKYKKIFAYFKPEAESLEALRRATRELGVKLIYCVDKKIYAQAKLGGSALTDRKMLGVLAKTLRENI